MRDSLQGFAELPPVFNFGPFALDVAAGTVRKGDEPIHLRPRSFQLLSYLVRHPGQVKSKSELIDAVWGPVAITDDAVAQSVIDIRRALTDDKRQIIKTVPRRGYVFNVPVEVSISGPHAPMAKASKPQRRGFVGVTAALAVLAVSAGVVATWLWPRVDDDPQPSVAVLAFDDFSANQSLQFFADGVAEEILNVLAPLEDLRVIARTSSFSLRDKRLDVETIGKRLGVTHVLEGSVRQAGGRFRVTAQLIETETSGHLWSATFEADQGDLFAMQDQIATAVVERLSATLGVDPVSVTGAEPADCLIPRLDPETRKLSGLSPLIH